MDQSPVGKGSILAITAAAFCIVFTAIAAAIYYACKGIGWIANARKKTARPAPQTIDVEFPTPVG